MQSLRDRRQFLGQCAAGSALAAGGWWTGTNPVQAIEPIVRKVKKAHHYLHRVAS